MMGCPHHRQQGDNYGVTCMDCGEALEGYGYWAEGSATCHHRFMDEGPDSQYETCMYCETSRIKSGDM